MSAKDSGRVVAGPGAGISELPSEIDLAAAWGRETRNQCSVSNCVGEPEPGSPWCIEHSAIDYNKSSDAPRTMSNWFREVIERLDRIEKTLAALEAK